jgi:hypothetical protein
MKQFLSRLLFFLVPFLVGFLALLGSYLLFDPFKVVHHHHSFSNSYVITNRDFISTETYLKNEKQQGYNSFIFGSSRTIAYRPASWKTHLQQDAVPFMFDASMESIYGIWKKIRFLDARKAPIKNVLIVLDQDVSFAHADDHSGHLFVKHPRISGHSSIPFHWTFFKAYCDINFLSAYVRYRATGKYVPQMRRYIEPRSITCHPVTNEVTMVDIEAELAEDSSLYYANRAKVFYRQRGESLNTTNKINEKHIRMMEDILSILDKHNADLKVVISPLYDQKKFSAADMLVLKKLFGKNLYDFSGVNRFTTDKSGWYESSHYRPQVGDSIMRIVYRKPL